MKLRQRILGKAWGDFRPSVSSREQLLALIRRATADVSPELQSIFAPQATFSNRVADANDPTECEPWVDWFGRSAAAADGGLVQGTRRAVGFFSGDCPIVCLWQDDRLAVLHAGYRCLIRESSGDADIIDAGLRHFNPRQVHAWIGLGIGPCCWIPGYVTKPEIFDPAGNTKGEVIQACLARTTSASPGGAGHVSVDLAELAKSLLISAGVSSACITIDRRCTCCWRQDDDFVCWSLTRAKTLGGADGRNFAFAWLEPSE